MDDKILGIFKMCLLAKKKGYNVFFNYSPHVNKIEVYKYQDGATFEHNEELMESIRLHAYLDEGNYITGQMLDEIVLTLAELI